MGCVRALPVYDPQATTIACPVCRTGETEAFVSVHGRDYRRCPVCEARFLVPSQRPTLAQEYAYYIQHENDSHDPGYRKFLFKLAGPLMARLGRPSRGLDYGCGPGPALAAMLREAGHAVALYDPFFHPDPAPLNCTYDFLTCTEAVEHFHEPAAEFDRLRALVRPGGWLALMTCFQNDDARFADWHYRRDPTHVVFYREATFHWLAARWGWPCGVPVKDVVLMQRPTAEAGCR